MDRIPYGQQSVHPDDIEAVSQILTSPWLTSGPVNDSFERAVAERVDAKHAVSFSSATAGLHAACFVAGLGPGDTVHTSPLTFMASANCARYVGARPALLDIDPTTYNIDLANVTPEVDSLVGVHYAGLPMDLAHLPTRPRILIEDAAHALGSSTPQGPVGNCASSDMTVFSFHPVKPITTAEGGLVTTNDEDLADRLRRFRSHGIVRESGDTWMYDAVEVGFNYRMNEMQAALGLSQLSRLELFIDRRNAVADRYRELLTDVPVILPPAAPNGFRHGYHLFAIRVPNRAEVFRIMRSRGIGVQVHYVPVHHHTVSRDIELPSGGFPVSDDVYAGLISIPLFPDLTDEQQDYVVEVLIEALT